MGRPRKPWSETVGEHGSTVRVEERAPGSTLRLRWWNSVREKHEYQALGHRDRERAVEQAKKLANMRLAQRTGRATLGQLVGLYLRHHAAKNSERWQAEMCRRGELVLRVFGLNRSPGDITDLEIDTFITTRKEGAIDARGRRVTDEDARRPVRAGTVGHDIKFLKAVTAWAADLRVGRDEYLLASDPLRSVEVPITENPRRPMATEERYQQTLEVAGQLSPYLPLLLQLVHETGQRIGAVRLLRYSDLRLNERTHHIRWRGEGQKNKKEAVLPINRAAREALSAHLREYPGVGEAWLFPHPEGGDRPASRFVTDRWLRDAEALAELEPLDGSLWHAYKRKWMTERSDFSAKERAVAANMKTARLVDEIYEQPEAARLEEVVERRRVVH